MHLIFPSRPDTAHVQHPRSVSACTETAGLLFRARDNGVTFRDPRGRQKREILVFRRRPRTTLRGRCMRPRERNKGRPRGLSYRAGRKPIMSGSDTMCSVSVTSTTRILAVFCPHWKKLLGKVWINDMLETYRISGKISIVT